MSIGIKQECNKTKKSLRDQKYKSDSRGWIKKVFIHISENQCFVFFMWSKNNSILHCHNQKSWLHQNSTPRLIWNLLVLTPIAVNLESIQLLSAFGMRNYLFLKFWAPNIKKCSPDIFHSVINFICVSSSWWKNLWKHKNKFRYINFYKFCFFRKILFSNYLWRILYYSV